MEHNADLFQANRNNKSLLQSRYHLLIGGTTPYVTAGVLITALLATLSSPASSTWPWLWVSSVLTLGSYLGNVRRKWWLYGCTVVSYSPIAVGAYRSMYKICIQDAWIGYILAAILLALPATGLLPHSGHDQVPQEPVVNDSVASPASEPEATEAPPEMLKKRSASAQSRSSRPKRSTLRTSKPPVETPESASASPTITVIERRMAQGSWKDLRGDQKPPRRRQKPCPLQTPCASRVEKLMNFDGVYHLTPLYRAPAKASRGQASPTNAASPTPEWAKVDRTPPPLSAARLEHSVAPKGPGPRVMEVQVLNEWRPSGAWLCDTTVDRDDRWDKVGETVLKWRTTCERLQSNRIARFSIGTSIETTDIVLGSMHLSLHDILDFFEAAIRDRARFDEPAQELEKFDRLHSQALNLVAAELIQFVQDYPQNALLGTMARLAAKTKRLADRWRTDLESVRDLAQSLGVEHTRRPAEAVKQPIINESEVRSVIEEWHHACEIWSIRGVTWFRRMINQQYSQPTSSLAKIAQQMLSVQAFIAEKAGDQWAFILAEVHRKQLAHVVAVMERKCKELGNLAKVSEFDVLVAGIKGCERAFQVAQPAVRENESSDIAKDQTSVIENATETHNEPTDLTAAAKQEFLDKIAQLGQEAQQRAAEPSVVDNGFARRRAACPYSVYSQLEKRAMCKDQNMEKVQISEKVFEERMAPWAEKFPDIFAGERHGKGRWTNSVPRSRARVDDFVDRPHQSKMRRIQDRRKADGLLEDDEQLAPTSEPHGLQWPQKRHLGDADMPEESREEVSREEIRAIGGCWQAVWEEQKSKLALESGELSGFEYQVALNKSIIEQVEQAGKASEMDAYLAFVDNEIPESPLQSLGERVPLQESQRAGYEETQSSAKGKGNSAGPPVPAPSQPSPSPAATAPPPAPTVEDAEDSQEEL